jgi:hypothetical protein
MEYQALLGYRCCESVIPVQGVMIGRGSRLTLPLRRSLRFFEARADQPDVTAHMYRDRRVFIIDSLMGYW